MSKIEIKTTARGRFAEQILGVTRLWISPLLVKDSTVTCKLFDLDGNSTRKIASLEKLTVHLLSHEDVHRIVEKLFNSYISMKLDITEFENIELKLRNIWK